MKHISQKEAPRKGYNQEKKVHPMKSIAKRLSRENSLMGSMGSACRMEEESTWSNINMAVYSMSLSLSAANFDLHFP